MWKSIGTGTPEIGAPPSPGVAPRRARPPGVVLHHRAQRAVRGHHDQVLLDGEGLAGGRRDRERHPARERPQRVVPDRGRRVQQSSGSRPSPASSPARPWCTAGESHGRRREQGGQRTPRQREPWRGSRIGRTPGHGSRVARALTGGNAERRPWLRRLVTGSVEGDHVEAVAAGGERRADAPPGRGTARLVEGGGDPGRRGPPGAVRSPPEPSTWRCPAPGRRPSSPRRRRSRSRGAPPAGSARRWAAGSSRFTPGLATSGTPTRNAVHGRGEALPAASRATTSKP